MNRRDFLRNGTRGLIVTALAAMSGVLIYRNNTTEQTCTFNRLCKDCKSLSKCNLPEGLTYKNQNYK